MAQHPSHASLQYNVFSAAQDGACRALGLAAQPLMWGSGSWSRAGGRSSSVLQWCRVLNMSQILQPPDVQWPVQL